jgi:DNA-binding MarR family transcriptional regulator
MVKQLHNDERSQNQADAAEALERLFELALLLADGMEHGLRERGLSRARAEVLWRLRHHGPVTQRALSQALRCTPRNVTGLLDGLQAAGLVTRAPHPSDRRATLVSLTDQGAAAAARMDAERQETAQLVFGGLSADDLARFVATVGEVRRRLTDDAGGS